MVGQSYLVCIDTAAGYQQTLPKTGTTDLASCSAVSGTRANGYGFSLPPTGKDSLLFGEVQTAPSIGGTVFGDTSNNGAQDAGETGLAGRTVKLLNAAGTTVLATSPATDPQDLSRSPARWWASPYLVCIDTAAGYQQTLRRRDDRSGVVLGGVGHEGQWLWVLLARDG